MMPFPFSVRFYLHIYSAVTFRRRIKMRRRPAGAVARKFESGREGRTYYRSYRACQNAGHIYSFLGEAVERSHFSGLCRNLHIQLLILEPVFLLLPAAAEEEEEEATSQ